MKKINKFGIWALALVALAGLFPQTAAASGSIRSITATDPETGHRDYGPGDLIRIGETLAFKVRLLNYNTNCTSTGGLNNPWSFRLRPGADETFAQANLPKIGLWISGHKRYATFKSIAQADNYYTDIVFEYKVQSGDMALPVKFCNVSGTSELANSADQLYLLENVGPLSYWELKDEATGHTCEFSFGAQNLVPSSTDNFEYPPAGWTSAGEVRDYDLSQAGIYVQTVDFDSDADPWRTIYENKTTTVEGTLPTLFIPGGASEDSTVYLWTESTNVAFLASGGEKIYHSLDHAGMPKDYLVYAANIVHATNFAFKVRGARGAAGQTTTIYLSATPTNIYNGAGTLISNFISRTIVVTNQANPEIVFELIPDSIVCDAAYGTSKALLHVTVDAFTNAIDVALNPTLGVGGPALPAGMIGLSTSADGALTFLDSFHVDAKSSLDDDPTELTFYIFGLGFATNDTYKTTSQTVVFKPTVTGDGGKYGTVDPVSLTVNEQVPVLGGAPASITVTAKEPYDLSLTVADSYANLHDATGYEVYWSNVTSGGTPSSASWKRLGTGNVVAVRQDDGTYTLDLKLSYPSAGTYDTYIYVKGPDGLVSTRSDFFFSVTVESAKRAILLTDHDTAPDGADWGDRQYNEDEAANPVKVEIALQSWRNETGGNLYAFLVPQEGTENYISTAKFLTTTEGARSNIKIAEGTTNSTATAANSTFYVLDGDKDHGDLSFWVVLATEQEWSAVTNGYDTIDDALSSANPKVVFVDQDNVPVEALNVEPKFNTVSMSGGSALTVGDGTETQVSDQGLLKTFTWSVAEVSADLPTLKSRWTVTYPSGAIDGTANGVVIEGNPATTNYQYKFQQTGVYTLKVEIQDKDMNPNKWVPFTFKVNVGNAPQTVFEMPDGTNGSERYTFNETAVMYGIDDYFRVGLSSAAADPLVIKVTRTPKATSDAGILEFAGAEADHAVYVTIPAGMVGPVARIDLGELDGTKGSSSSTGGFMLTATVTNTMVNADGTPYNEVYGATEIRVLVGNVAPSVEVYPEPGSKSSTNEFYEASVSANEPLNIEWVATDVDADVSDNLTLRWTGLPSGATYTAGSNKSAEGNIQFAFDSSGSHTVTLTIADKDKGSSETFTFIYRIASSKNVYITPLGPSRSGQSRTSNAYLGAHGLGKGRVCMEGGNGTSIRAFRQSWSYLIDDASAIAWAFGYRVGDVDDGSLPQFDRPIDRNGNNLGTTIATYYKYPDTQFDSFFYAWINNVSDDQGSTTGAAYANPQIGKDDSKYHIFDLPSEQEGEEDNPYFKPLVLEAVFALEWLPSDNLGDINADGIPDQYAVNTVWDAGYLYQQGENGGGGGEDDGAIGGGDLKKLNNLNEDEDYLPSPTADGGTLIPTVHTWATIGKAFSAREEIRGFGDGLNYREDMQAGTVNYNVRGLWISDPDFTPAETAAYLRYCATKLDTSDPAVVALAEAACTAAGGDPTDPAQLEPYLSAALEEYAKSDEFKAAVFQPDYLATVDWSPENRTDPTMTDTDGDGLPDGYEYYFWYRALVGDEKGKQLVGSRFNPDNIAQGIDITPEEIVTNFNPTVANDYVGQRDTDGDGLTDLEELVIGTNPIHWDSDGDGMSDLYEVMWALNPLKTPSVEEADKNPDGDFMASWKSEPTWAIVTVPDVGVFAVDESESILDGFVEGDSEKQGTLDTSVQSSIAGIPVFWYGADGSTAVPKIRMAQPGRTLLTSTVVVPVGGIAEPITVKRDQSIRLIHDQVRAQFGFDPRTGWGRVGETMYVSERWDPSKSSNKSVGRAGWAENTEAFTSLDEYLLCKYRKETGLPGGEKDQEDDWFDDHANARRVVVNLLWKNCTCPNMPFSGVSYPPDGGSDETQTQTQPMSFDSDIYGADTDGDGVPDGWELYVSYNPNLAKDASANEDWTSDENEVYRESDALSLADEFAGTDSCNTYSNTPSIFNNHPGNKTGWFNKFFPTNPWNYDTDGDGVSDSDEGSDGWLGSLPVGHSGGESGDFATMFTFIYGDPVDDGTCCIRGGGLNPCTVDTDSDLLPDGWERQFAGVVFGVDGQPLYTSLRDEVIFQFLVSDGIYSLEGRRLATPSGPYITGGQDGTYGYRSDQGIQQPGDAFTYYTDSRSTLSVDPRTGTVRNCDWDHDGLQNFQEYLVQTLRHLRYDDSETPLMGTQLENGKTRLPFNKCIPFQAFDGTAFYETCRAAGFRGTSAWKFRELGYFTRPPHAWDALSLNPVGNNRCQNYENYEGVGYRVLLPPRGLSPSATVSSGERIQASGYVSTDPRKWDSDGDGLDDFWELFHGLNPLLGSAEQMGLNDVIAAMYGGEISAWNNAWTGWPSIFASQPPFDAMKYPWMIGTPECDADGDGIRNAEEGLFVNITTPSPTHTDPTPLWMTDSTSPNNVSYTAQYYRADPYVDSMNMGIADICRYPSWVWGHSDASGSGEGSVANWMFAFEENEGYDTDGDRQPDSAESVKMVENASDALNFSDPDRRQALYLPGWHRSTVSDKDIGSAVVSRGGADTFQRPVSSCFDMLRQFTVEAWVKPEKFDAEQVILERVANYGPSTLSNDTSVIRANFRLGIAADNRFYAECQGNTTNSATARLFGPQATTNWTHLAFTYNGSRFALYINDEEAPLDSIDGASIIPANGIVLINQDVGSMGSLAIPESNFGYSTVPCAFIIGARAATAKALTLMPNTTWDAFGDYYTGWIDEVRVWDGARTGAEIAADYRKRYSFNDVKAQRQTVYDDWKNGATRNDVYGAPLPAELLQHYSFTALAGAVDAGGVAREPSGFRKNVLDNVRIDGKDENNAPLDAGGLNVGWWWKLPVRSDVYCDYHTVPWVQNTCAHLPFMDGSTADSMFWSEGFGGVMTSLEEGLESYSFPNTAHPYPFYNFLDERPLRLAMLNNWSKFYNQALAENYDYAQRYQFQMRSGFVGTSDLVPLGGAFAKRSDMLWDGASADAWTQTGGDTDGDGLPDWWEAFVAAGGNDAVIYLGPDGLPLDPDAITWSAMVRRNGVTMTLAQAYLRDLADGMVYRWDEASGRYEVAVDSAYAAKIDEDGNSILDWWEKLYGIQGEAIAADHDNDQLSNFAEYLIGECFAQANGKNRKPGYSADDVFKTLDPTKMRTYGEEGQLVPDYFRRVGSLYLGEMFADYDFMEDTWESKFDADTTSVHDYDPDRDPDGDGWSNYAEARAGTDPSRSSSILPDGETLPEYPIPMVRLRTSFPDRGKPFSGSNLVIRAYAAEHAAGAPDAVWHMSAGAPVAFTRNLGMNPCEKISFNLGSGKIVPGTISIQFRDLAMLRHTAAGANIWLAPSSTSWEEAFRDSNYVHGKPSPISAFGTVMELGTIDYETGDITLDFSKTKGVYRYSSNGVFNFYEPSTTSDWTRVSLENSFVRISWTGKIDAGERKWETVLAMPNVSGHLREGKVVFEVFDDAIRNGRWDAGEPYGVSEVVDVGWNMATVEVELTATHPSMARYDLGVALGTTKETSSGITDRDMNGSIDPNVVVENTATNDLSTSSVRLRIVRTAINGMSIIGSSDFSWDPTDDDTHGEKYGVVLDQEGINAGQRGVFSEIFLAAKLAERGEFDLDWGNLRNVWSEMGGGQSSPADIRSATYRLVVGNGRVSNRPDDGEAHLPVEFVNSFEALAYQTPVTPLSPNGMIDSARPTFTWRHDNTIGKSYPAFQLRIWKADGTTLVYDSGVRRAPVRSPEGVYSWTAPICAGTVMDNGQMFSATSSYQWAVSMLDAKFTQFNPREAKTSFRLECSGEGGNVSDNGTVALKVKYFGPGVVSAAATSSRNSLIRVQAFDTPDFTGNPAGETYVADVADLASISNLTVNARIVGLKPGTYYVRAFIDTNGDGLRQPWESWGYVNYVGTENASVYAPKGLEIVAGNTDVPCAPLYIEDADTDNDGFPDVYEWNQNGNLTAIGPATGNSFFTKVNPDLLATLEAYTGLSSAMAVAATPMGRMMRSATGSASGNKAVAALLSPSPSAVENATDISVTIESFSLDEGIVVSVDPVVSVGSSGLLTVSETPIAFRLELRHKASLAESDWETVASVPLSLKANETATFTADDLSVLRKKIAEMSASGQTGFFKVVLSQ